MNKLGQYILGIQHTLAMFGSTVLVPYLTGLPTSLALIGAGIGTLLFHTATQKKVPMFIGSSFAFITSTQYVLAHESIGALKGAIMFAGLLYLLIALIVYYIGVDKVNKLLPPIVIGPIIMSIGLKLVPVALSMSGYDNGKINGTSLALALTALTIMIVVSCLQRSFFRFMPILTSIIITYIIALAFGFVDTSIVSQAPWLGFDHKATEFFTTTPIFSLSAILMVAPIAIVTLAEHIGEIKSNSAIVGKDFMKDPGLHRTLSGDGLATMFAGLIGGPVNTTYAENTGVLAATKIYDPSILRKAAIMAIIIALCGKVISVIQSIPTPIMGGISLVLFGLIAAIGLRILAEGNVNFNHYRNLVIPALVIIMGIFIDGIPVGNFVFSGLFCATVGGIILNQILPEPKK